MTRFLVLFTVPAYIHVASCSVESDIPPCTSILSEQTNYYFGDVPVVEKTTLFDLFGRITSERIDLFGDQTIDEVVDYIYEPEELEPKTVQYRDQIDGDVVRIIRNEYSGEHQLIGVSDETESLGVSSYKKFTYDNGLLSQMSEDIDGDGVADILTDYLYEEANLVQEISREYGLIRNRNYEYDSNGLVVAISVSRNGTLQDQYSYTYNDLGLVSSETLYRAEDKRYEFCSVNTYSANSSLAKIAVDLFCDGNTDIRSEFATSQRCDL